MAANVGHVTQQTSCAEGGRLSWEDHLRARRDERRPGLYPLRIRPFLGRPMADGRFVTDGYIGRGAFGCVFEGKQTSLNGRPVAIKLLIPPTRRELDTELNAQFERAAYYFEREAAILARLNHPCIVQVLDSGIEDGALWIAMELVAGRNLGEMLADPNEVWTWPRIARLSRGVLAGLAAAHSEQIIHRDLKPPNIMVTNPVGLPDSVKLLDFGVAKLFRLIRDHRSQTIIGTPEFMAPEQWTAGTIDARTDLYAFGVILYQMVSGGLPFQAGDVRALSDLHVHASVPPPQPRVGLMRIAAVDEIVMRAMSKNADARFPDALSMLGELDAAIREGNPEARDILPTVVRQNDAPARPTPSPAGPGDVTLWGPPIADTEETRPTMAADLDFLDEPDDEPLTRIQPIDFEK